MDLAAYAMRPATQGDFADLHAIFTHQSVSPYLGFEPCDAEAFQPIFAEQMAEGHLVVREGADGRVESVVKIIPNGRRRRHVVYLGSLAVHWEARGRGVGRAFLRDLMTLLQGDGFSRIEIQVAGDNLKAIAFFKSFGFEIEGTHYDYFCRADRPGELFNAHFMAWLATRAR